MSTSIDTLNLFPAVPTNSIIQFARMPELNYVIQEVNLPGFSVTPAKVQSSGHNMLHAPDRIQYEPLTVSFLVDEQYRAHRELHAWFYGMTGREDRSVLTAQFIDNQLHYMSPSPNRPATLARASSTTAGLTIVNGAKIPVLRAIFFGIIPQAVGSIQYSTKDDNLTVLHCTATFEYEYYSLVEIPR